MTFWSNLLGYQVTWFVAVIGAGHAKSWPACVATVLFCGVQLAASSWRGLDVRLMALAGVLGVLVDGTLASTGLLTYAPAKPATPLLGCPWWIFSLWLAFATTLTRSFAWLRGRLGPAALIGAAGGPLAYEAAARGWGVIGFEAPLWRGVVALALGWAIALMILARTATPAMAGQPTAAEKVDFP